MLFIGIDLGTSACKLLLVGEDGTIQNEVTKEYPLSFPHPGWAEQRPEEWWDAVVTGVPELLRGFDANDVAGIGSGGQMHGLVALDEHDHVIRPAILWNDGRTFKEVEYLNNVVGKDRLSELTANIAFAGFTAPKLLWMRENELENFEKIAKIMLPKDYLTYKLTGIHACDYSDASGMLLLDVQHKRWSKEMLEICGVSERQMPKLFESFAVVGRLTKEAAQTLGLPETVKVVAGAGDNAAAAVGTGTVGAGGCNLSLGTSGTIFISSDKFGVDPNNALHAFAHADGGYHLMGCMLSAASCNKWLCEEILKTSDFSGEQADITDEKLGENHVYFLPYLMGERSPINDTNARGTFTGMTMDTSRSDMVQAVFERGALAIALAVLRPDRTPDGRQGRGAVDHLIGGLKVALGHMADELGDIDAHGAAGLAGLILAVDAALCLVHGHLFGIAQCNFLKVLVADVGVLGGHGALFGIHIESHFTFPPES